MATKRKPSRRDAVPVSRIPSIDTIRTVVGKSSCPEQAMLDYYYQLRCDTDSPSPRCSDLRAMIQKGE